jgi:hypothetical protein
LFEGTAEILTLQWRHHFALVREVAGNVAFLIGEAGDGFRRTSTCAIYEISS